MDLEVELEEYDTGEKLTVEENIKFEEELNKYIINAKENEIKELKEENECLKAEVEDMKRKLEEETKRKNRGN